MHPLLISVLAGLLLISSSSRAAPEGMKLSPSPRKKLSRTFGPDEKVIDYAISAEGGRILALVNDGKPGSRFSLLKISPLPSLPKRKHVCPIPLSQSCLIRRNQGYGLFSSAQVRKGPGRFSSWRTSPPLKFPEEKQAFFISHRAHSDFDQKVALRPAVYLWKAGMLRPLWKGSALAYPVEDMDILSDRAGEYLCALHSEVSHFLGKKVPEALKTLAYRWNGFGFSRDPEEKCQEECRT